MRKIRKSGLKIAFYILYKLFADPLRPSDPLKSYVDVTGRRVALQAP
jgi:hypothetical protein